MGVKYLAPRCEELHELVIGMGLQGAFECASEIEHLWCPILFISPAGNSERLVVQSYAI